MGVIKSFEIEHNLYNLYRKAAQAGDLLCTNELYYSVVSSEFGYWPNYCFNLHCPKIKLEEVSKKLANEMRSFKAPPFIVVGTEVDQQLLNYLLVKQDLKMINQWTSMALNLIKCPELLPIENFDITKVSHPQHLSIFLKFVTKWLMNGRLLDPIVFNRFMNDENIGLYLVWIDGEAVATSLLYCNNGIAGIYMLAVNNQYRRMGLGKATITHLIADAVKQNCTQVVLHATRMGEKLYRTLGFDAYGKIDIYSFGTMNLNYNNVRL